MQQTMAQRGACRGALGNDPVAFKELQRILTVDPTQKPNAASWPSFLAITIQAIKCKKKEKKNKEKHTSALKGKTKRAFLRYPRRASIRTPATHAHTPDTKCCTGLELNPGVPPGTDAPTNG